MSAMPQLRIADLLANSPSDPEAHLDALRVERYAQMLNSLPPVVVFDTGEELLLVDGHHRVAAARRRRLETIEAEVRHGTRQDALRYPWGLAPHSAASPPTLRPRTSGGAAKGAGPQSAEFPRTPLIGSPVSEKIPLLGIWVNKGRGFRQLRLLSYPRCIESR